jgi:hypothetical protein
LLHGRLHGLLVLQLNLLLLKVNRALLHILLRRLLLQRSERLLILEREQLPIALQWAFLLLRRPNVKGWKRYRAQNWPP